MAYRRPLHVIITAMCGVLIAAGAAACSGGSGSSSATTASSGSQAGADAATSEAAPAPEQTNPEQPQPPQGKPGVEVVSLPVGGGGPSQNPDCVDVRWSDPAFRDGVKIVISDVRVTGDFEEQGTSCDTPCRNYVFSSDQGSCQVRVGYAIPQTPRDLNGTVELGGNCVAPDDATCQKVKEDVANAPGHVVHLGVSADELPQNPGNGAGSQSSGSQGESSASDSSASQS
jgi:hypothetical protein